MIIIKNKDNINIKCISKNHNLISTKQNFVWIYQTTFFGKIMQPQSGAIQCLHLLVPSPGTCRSSHINLKNGVLFYKQQVCLWPGF